MQVGQVILTLPTAMAQMGYGLGIFVQILFAVLGCWTAYLLSGTELTSSAHFHFQYPGESRFLVEQFDVVSNPSFGFPACILTYVLPQSTLLDLV